MTIKDLLRGRLEDVFESSLKALELVLIKVQARRNAICTYQETIPDTIGGHSTEGLRKNLATFCAGLEAFGRILQAMFEALREPCLGLSEVEEEACLRAKIAQYGVEIPDGDFDVDGLRNILRALRAVGEKVAQCINFLTDYHTDPEEAFKRVFKTEERPIQFVYDPNRSSALTQAFGADDQSAGPGIPIARFEISLARSTFAFEGGGDRPDEIVMGNIIHELGHVFLRLLLEGRGYEVSSYTDPEGNQQYPVTSTGFDVSTTYTFIVRYVEAIGAEWGPTTGIYEPGDFGGALDPGDSSEIQRLLRSFFYNAPRGPQEDFVDTFSVVVQLGETTFLEDTMVHHELRQELEASPRIRFFDSFCCWVFELMGLDLREVGCDTTTPDAEGIP